MALENLFVRKKYSIGGIRLDGVIVERFSNSVRLTKNPVELGVNITDHAIIEPKRYSFDGIVSNTPLGIASIGVIVDNITGLFGDSTGGGATRAESAYNDLLVLMNNREPINVQTGLGLLENMVITGVYNGRDKDTSGALFFSMDLEEVIITQTETVVRSSDNLTGDQRMGGAEVNNKGRQTQKPVAPENERSILLQLIDNFSSE